MVEITDFVLASGYAEVCVVSTPHARRAETVKAPCVCLQVMKKTSEEDISLVPEQAWAAYKGRW